MFDDNESNWSQWQDLFGAEEESFDDEWGSLAGMSDSDPAERLVTPAVKKRDAAGALQYATGARPPPPARHTSQSSSSSSTTPAAKRQRRGFSFGPEVRELATSLGEWTRVDAKHLTCAESNDEAVGGDAWAKSILRNHPPCMSLKGQSGEPSQPHKLRRIWLKKAPQPHWDGDVMRCKASSLAALYHRMLARVRYPPHGLELHWKADRLEVDRLRGVCLNEIPAEMTGDVPTRPFKLMSNSEDPMAEQPPHFTGPQLRPEQLRSLWWMLSQEGHQQRQVAGLAETEDSFHVDWRCYWTQPGREDFFHLALARRILHPTDAALASRTWAANLSADSKLRLLSLDGDRARIVVLRDQGGDDLPLFWDFDLEDVEVECDAGDLCPPVPKLEPGALVTLKSDSMKSFPSGSIGAVQSLSSDGSIHVDCCPTETCGLATLAPGCASARVGFLVPSSNTRLASRGTTTKRVPIRDVELAGEGKDILELKARAFYKIRGGLLCDSIGYGKTATTIGLISSTLHSKLPHIPAIDKDSFIPAQGTLIIVPANLFDQWLSELAKFTWDGNSLRGRLSSGWSPKGCPLKIFAASTVTPLKSARARQIAEADIVLCSYRMLYSLVYQKQRQQLADSVPADEGEATPSSELSKVADLVRILTKGGPKAEEARARLAASNRDGPGDLKFPVLEMFYWKRIVFDEFHELESIQSSQQHTLHHLRSHYRWGLTGTPPIDSNAGVVLMASLFRIDLAGILTYRCGVRDFPYLAGGSQSRLRQVEEPPNLAEWESDRLLTEAAVRFLDHYARQNTSELPEIRLQNHVVFVRHSPAERVLYLAQSHDAPDFAALGSGALESEDARQAVEKLLKLCSHFQAGGGEAAANAQDECLRIGEQKERQVSKAKRQVTTSFRVLTLLEETQRMKQPKKMRATDQVDWRRMALREAETDQGSYSDSKSSANNSLKEIVEELLAHVERESPESRRSKVIDNPQTEDAVVKFLVAQKNAESGSCKLLLRAQAQQQVENVTALRTALASLDFFQQALKAVSETRSCSICLDDEVPLSRWAITPCAHTFCIDCLTATVKQYGTCSICRRALKTKDIRPIEAEMPAQEHQPAHPTSTASSSSSSSTGARDPADAAADPKLADAGVILPGDGSRNGRDVWSLRLIHSARLVDIPVCHRSAGVTLLAATGVHKPVEHRDDPACGRGCKQRDQQQRCGRPDASSASAAAAVGADCCWPREHLCGTFPRAA
mmetsp:Transcript_1388/g.3013  ORF Transcript_1388/g.3013 Transcript_1388/m.3013 type:complete len:1237 (-) Transcript_1388:388-4098(-)